MAMVVPGLEVSVEAIIKLIPHDEDDVLYISGSLVEGYGNPRSDIDVFRLYSNPDVKYRQFMYALDGQFFDCENWLFSEVENMAEKIRNVPLNDADVNVYIITEPQVKFLNRLCIGKAIYNHNEFEAIKNSIDWEKLAKINARTSIMLYDNISDDVIGMIENGDFDSACLWSRKMLDKAIDAWICSKYCDSNMQDKWRIKRLYQRLDAEDTYIRDFYFKVNFQGCAENELEKRTMETVTFAEKLIQKLQARQGGI